MGIGHADITTLENLHKEMRDGFKTMNGRLRTQEAWTARLQGAGAILLILGFGNVIALLVDSQ